MNLLVNDCREITGQTEVRTFAGRDHRGEQFTVITVVRNDTAVRHVRFFCDCRHDRPDSDRCAHVRHVQAVLQRERDEHAAMLQAQRETCPTCHGAKYVTDPSATSYRQSRRRCWTCDGYGTVTKTSTEVAVA